MQKIVLDQPTAAVPTVDLDTVLGAARTSPPMGFVGYADSDGDVWILSKIVEGSGYAFKRYHQILKSIMWANKPMAGIRTRHTGRRRDDAIKTAIDRGCVVHYFDDAADFGRYYVDNQVQSSSQG